MKNLANIITFGRTLLSLFILLLLNGSDHLKLIGTLLIPIAMIMDMFDGFIARKTKTETLNGSTYDILADRMIEYSFFIFFAFHHICSFWATLIIIWRGLLLDTIRSIAARTGKTAFGEKSMHQSLWAKLLTSSRFSRGTYNTLKTIAFITMALQLYKPIDSWFIEGIVWITVGWSLLRAVPVIFDGYNLANENSKKRSILRTTK